MVVVVLLGLIWAAVLVPPAVQAQAARRDAFVGSFGTGGADRVPPPAGAVRPGQVQRRRRIAGGLLIAMTGTLLVGLLPTFRVLLVVHLFLLDSFIAYVALLAHMAARRARAEAVADEADETVVPALEPEPAPELAGPLLRPERPRVRRRLVPAPATLDLPPVFPAR